MVSSKRSAGMRTTGFKGVNLENPENNKELSEKFEKLEGLLLHSLKVMEKMAISMDGIPEAL
jgi:hypothetical protein